jgi:hypothetical protein
MNEYSTNGTLTGTSANADYTLRMNGLINDAQHELAKKRKISATYTLPDTPDSTTTLYNKYNMPADFMEIKCIYKDEYPFGGGLWDWKTLSIKKEYTGTFTVSYYKYPTEVNDSTLDTFQLELDPDVQTLIPYYVGGYLMIDENPAVGIQLLNQYQARLDAIGGGYEFGVQQIQSPYSMGWC